MIELPVLAVENLIGLLQICRQRKDCHQARQVHAYLHDRHLGTHAVLGNYLVPTLVECGSLLLAQEVFDSLAYRNVYSWTSLISGYIECGNSEHALLLHHRMQQDHVPSNNYTFLALLKGCIQLQIPDKDHCTHSEVVKHGLDRDLSIGNTLVDMYGKRGCLAEAHCVFAKLLPGDAISWNALIAGYAEHGLGEEALTCLKQMQLGGICPDDVTFTCSLKACGSIEALEEGRLLHMEIVKQGLENDLLVGCTMVDMYAKCGSLTEAQLVFAKLPAKDAVSWNVLMSAYAEYGLGEEALCSFRQMQLEGISPADFTFLYSLKGCGGIGALQIGQQLHSEIAKRGLEGDLLIGSAMVDVYGKCRSIGDAQKVFNQLPVRAVCSWNALIAGYAEHGFGEEALCCFERMQDEGMSPDDVTFPCALKSCGTTGALETGQAVHAQLTQRGLESDFFVANTLIDMYGKCGAHVEGRGVFDKLPMKDVVSWTAMIKGYGENHEGKLAIQCFEDMLQQGVKPNAITFTSVLAACSHASLVLKGHEYFQVMKEKYVVEPTRDHYSCMVDLLARSGHVYEAERFAEAIKCVLPADALKSLLTASKVHGDVELGLRCFQQLIQVNQEDASAYSLMVDIYASAGRWNDANVIEEMRKQAGLKKLPAIATTEVNRKCYGFVVGCIQTKYLTAMLDNLKSHMKVAGYVADLELVLTDFAEDENDSTLVLQL